MVTHPSMELCSDEIEIFRRCPPFTLTNRFRMLESLGTDPKIHYQSRKAWVREISSAPRPGRENARG